MRIKSAVVLGCLMLGGIAFAQQPARPEFEVASVKLNTSGLGVPSRNLRPGSKSHRETKELPVYILTVAKDGPHFKMSVDDGPMGAFVKEGTMNYRRASMAYLAGRVLSNFPTLGRPVVDRTGLDGVYDFSLRLFDPDAANSETNPKGDTLQQLDNGLSASLEDLGLKLEALKTPIEMLIIDSVSKPDAN
jgi:uncharacterized protein (TIGR03435 family)